MGIMLSYTGSLADPARAAELEQDLGALCDAMGWRHRPFHEATATSRARITDVRGISLLPHARCEWVHFHVDPSGRFVNHFYYGLVKDSSFYAEMTKSMGDNRRQIDAVLKSIGHTPARPGRSSSPRIEVVSPGIPADLDEGVRYNWVKTQHAGPETHIAVCRVLEYVKRRYAPNLEIHDDSGYFVHRNVEALKAEMAMTDAILDRVRAAFGAPTGAPGPVNTTATLDELLRRLDSCLDDSALH